MDLAWRKCWQAGRQGRAGGWLGLDEKKKQEEGDARRREGVGSRLASV